MDKESIRQIFEAYFEKYKKTEGDESSWSAVWDSRSAAGSFEINMTKCPAGTIFKPFADGKKLPEINGWEAFLATLPELEREYSGFDADRFFSEMGEVV